MKIYKFRNCLLNTIERSVLMDGKRLDLTPKTFDVLQMLVERPGEIVTKDEMLGRVWNGSFVEEGNLPVHVAKLRRQLDGDGNHRFIETVHGGGYRFTANVEIANEGDWQKQFAGFNRRKSDRQPHQQVLDSIAVLPFRNETNDAENDYLADGLTESVINRLSRTTSLRVMARDTVFRYKNKDVDAKEVGDTLGVAAVLTGRIKLIKDNLLVGVELVRVADRSQLWGKQFDQPFSDIIKIKDTIATIVTEQLQPKIAGASTTQQTKPVTQNAESYRLYLKGKYFQEKDTEADLYKAIEYFQQSVSHDPENVLSYVEIIESYLALYSFNYLQYGEWSIITGAILEIAAKLDQSVDVLQVVYGGVKLHKEWDFEAAENHLQSALTLNPNCVIGHIRYSALLLRIGRFTEALRELQIVIELDPLSLPPYKLIARLFYGMGEYEQTRSYLVDALEMDPEDYVALNVLGAVLTQTGNYQEALEALQKSLSIAYNVETLSDIGCAQALAGKTNAARQMIKRIEFESKDNNKHRIRLAAIHAALGEKGKAYEFLEQAFEEHECDLSALGFNPRWASLRHEPRFIELMKRVGIPTGEEMTAK
ncbi:MAG: winged helix-turn-helix domain-containing protein [Pyrinomonadaceae bacterium]